MTTRWSKTCKRRRLAITPRPLKLKSIIRDQIGDPRSVDPKMPDRDVFSQKRDRHADNDFRSSDEKRAYFRLLRHLLTEKLQASFKEDQARSLPPRMADLLKKLEHP